MRTLKTNVFSVYYTILRLYNFEMKKGWRRKRQPFSEDI